MSISLNAVFGLLMMVVGGLKTWLHAGSLTALTLTTCNGKTINLALGESHWAAQAHCWGCYLFVGGAALVLLALFTRRQKRRSVALRMD